MARLVYDRTYSYINGTLEIETQTIRDQYFTCSRDKILSSKLYLQESPWHEVIITKPPEKGSLTMNSDGSFNYYPEKEFKGEVDFEFTYSISFSYSQECRAVITVE